MQLLNSLSVKAGGTVGAGSNGDQKQNWAKGTPQHCPSYGRGYLWKQKKKTPAFIKNYSHDFDSKGQYNFSHSQAFYQCNVSHILV